MMKQSISILFLIFSLTIAKGQRNCKNTFLLVDLLLEKYIEPRTIDNEFSIDVYIEESYNIMLDLLNIEDE